MRLVAFHLHDRSSTIIETQWIYMVPSKSRTYWEHIHVRLVSINITPFSIHGYLKLVCVHDVCLFANYQHDAYGMPLPLSMVGGKWECMCNERGTGEMCGEPRSISLWSPTECEEICVWLIINFEPPNVIQPVCRAE